MLVCQTRVCDLNKSSRTRIHSPRAKQKAVPELELMMAKNAILHNSLLAESNQLNRTTNNP